MTEIALPYFLSLPVGPRPWPGVVVVHEGNGISAQLLRVCERLAAVGYAAIAPDLFFRMAGSGSTDFPTLMASLERDRTQADIASAADTLRAAGADRIGITGFCMGGRLAYRTAVTTPGFDAAVGFYGGGIASELGEPQCPTQLLFGADDEYITPDDIAAVVAHHPGTVVYPGAGHGFMRDGSDSYHEQAATDGWQRLLAFFGEHLR